jgi:hypothetical protein
MFKKLFSFKNKRFYSKQQEFFSIRNPKFILLNFATIGGMTLLYFWFFLKKNLTQKKGLGQRFNQ